MNTVIKILLLPFSFLYGTIVSLRNLLFDAGVLKSYSAGIPVINVGNLTVGGTGKTPHIEYLVNLLSPRYKVAVLSRGYKRSTKGYRLVSVNDDATTCGDEPLQIKQKFPDILVAVCEKRVDGAKALLLEPNAPEIILLDDAYQHRYIQRDINILLTDYNRPIYKDFVFPAGLLREPGKGSNRADIVIVTKCPDNIETSEKLKIKKRLKLKEYQKLYFSNIIYGNPLSVFGNKDVDWKEIPKKITALTGIANPIPFWNHLEQKGFIINKLSFPDHHHFNTADIDKILNTLHEGNAMITTEKDATRLKNIAQLEKLSIYYIPVIIGFSESDKENFDKQFTELLQ